METADGQRKAIIGEGEWIQLVGEGQRLADNSRVVKVTSTSVEIIRQNGTQVALLQARLRPAEAAQVAQVPAGSVRPPSESAAEDSPGVVDEGSLADVEDSPKTPDGVGPVRAPGEKRLPHEVEAEASLASGWCLPPSRPEPRVVEPRRPASARPASEAAPPAIPREVAGPPKPLGFVQRADGTTLTVMSDGDSVRLEEQPLVASVTPPSLPVDLPGGRSGEIPETPPGLASRLPSPHGSGSGIGPVTTLKALGYVEHTSGWVQAILDAGDSVQLVEEGQLLADGSRVVGITPSSVTVAFAAGEPLSEPRPREQDLLAATRVWGGMLSRSPAPPSEVRLAAPEPVPKARGMSASRGHAAYSRPPPDDITGHWTEERSRGQPAEEKEGASTTCRTRPASTTREASRATETRGEGGVCLRKGSSKNGDDLNAPSEQYSIRPLGFVEWPGGRIQAIVSKGDSVELLEEGQTLSDGARVVAVSHDAVELSRTSRAASGGRRAGPGPEKERAELVTAVRGGRDIGSPTEPVVLSPGLPGIGLPAVLGFPGGVPGIDPE